MEITNKQGLPEALVTAVRLDPYTRGDSDYSVTELLKPPRITALTAMHKDKLVDDASDRLWSLYGQIVHTILERANQADLVEQRFYAEFSGKRVGGQFDNLSIASKTLSDWKFTTSWGFKLGQPIKAEWVAQLNMLLEILRRQPQPSAIEKLQIIGLLRDWSILEAKRTSDYPKKGVVTVPIEMWSREQTVSFIEHRIELHEAARKITEDKDLPLCSGEDRWAKQDMWAVMKGQRAIRFGLCFSEKAAEEMQRKNADTRIEFRPGFSTRCNSYCSVSDFCSQYQTTLKGAEDEISEGPA